MWVNLPAVRAQRMLDARDLMPESIRDLTLVATGSAGLAEDAYVEALAARMRRQNG